MIDNWVEVTLRGYGGADKPIGASFFEQLGLKPDPGFATAPAERIGSAATVLLLEISTAEVRDFEEPYEEFARRFAAGMCRAADWLLALPAGALDQWRASGHKADIFLWIKTSDDQYELKLPWEFLAACGKYRLPIASDSLTCVRFIYPDKPPGGAP